MAEITDHYPEFLWPVRVYYEDTDLAGVVYYANYLKYLERARTEWLRQLGFQQSLLKTDHDVIFMVKRLEINYIKPARFDDYLVIGVQVSDCRRASLVLRQWICRDTEILNEAQVTLAAVNATTGRARAIPLSIVHALTP
jgi:acyl-CoA thioester hydrolase